MHVHVFVAHGVHSWSPLAAAVPQNNVACTGSSQTRTRARMNTYTRPQAGVGVGQLCERRCGCTCEFGFVFWFARPRVERCVCGGWLSDVCVLDSYYLRLMTDPLSLSLLLRPRRASDFPRAPLRWRWRLESPDKAHKSSWGRDRIYADFGTYPLLLSRHTPALSYRRLRKGLTRSLRPNPTLNPISNPNHCSYHRLRKGLTQSGTESAPGPGPTLPSTSDGPDSSWRVGVAA